ncbi:MAG: apolipoprotein N-acyltransferase [Verrucomicrobia bacterium]|nr:apolipoprotein N-acyltransferase [Verrucomicrobiota bacterium]
MNFVRSFIQSRYPLAIVAGLLLAASFPKIGIAGCAWIAPGLMLAVAFGQTGKQVFRIGYVVGMAHYLATLYWLLLIPVRGAPILGWLALSTFLALYPATWVWLVSKVAGFKVEVANSTAPTKLSLADAVFSSSWIRRTGWALCGAAIWVALEMTQARFLSGFPWNLLGTSQYKILPLIQIASITGVYGVSFLVVWCSLSMLCALVAVIQRPKVRSAWVGELLLPLLVVGIVFGCGYRKIMQPASTGRELTLALVQPSIPQTLIWDANENTNRFQQLLKLSEQALTNHPDVLLWPEAAVPNLLRWHEPTYRAVTGLARSNKVWMIIGADDAEPRRNTPNPNDADYFNSSFLISPQGEIVKSYRKRLLVVFGEYIPLVRWLPFLTYFTPIEEGGFTPGDRPVPFELRDLRVKTSVLICFEDNFPHAVRDYVDDDTDFLVNLTNNGWFGEGAAQWQHAANAIFRTVENGLPLVRCTNNGLTCWVDANGRLRDVFGMESGNVYGSGFITIRVPLLPLGQKREPTFYHQHGDWFGWGCVFATVLMMTKLAIRRKSATD